MKKLLLFTAILLCGQLNAQTDSNCTVVVGVTSILGKISTDLHLQLYKDSSLLKEAIKKSPRCTLDIPEAGKYHLVVKSDAYPHLTSGITELFARWS